jgi:hypothetical protein
MANPNWCAAFGKITKNIGPFYDKNWGKAFKILENL